MIAGHDLEDILAAWRIGSVRRSTGAPSGAVNRTMLIEAASGEYALRAYRHHDRAPIVCEHAVIAHVRAYGLPAIGPLSLPDGATILERDGRFYALFPRATGRHLPAPDVGPGEAAALGTMLAQLHRALRDVPPDYATTRTFAIDRTATLAAIAHLEDVIRALARRDPVDAAALARLAGQRAWIERHPDDAAIDLAQLPCQVIHGDYQLSNVFFDAGRISAVIDWDQTYLAPRAWEMVRAFHYAFDFAPTLCRAFVDGYRGEEPLTLADLDVAATAYSLMRAYDLWHYQAVYLEGNERVRAFIGPARFVPVAERWAALRPFLAT